jgi:hypothetical protein
VSIEQFPEIPAVVVPVAVVLLDTLQVELAELVLVDVVLVPQAKNIPKAADPAANKPNA